MFLTRREAIHASLSLAIPLCAGDDSHRPHTAEAPSLDPASYGPITDPHLASGGRL